MKKYIITIIIALGMVINVSAQGDGFFSFGSNDSREGTSSGEWGEAMLALPNSYTATDNFNANAPLGSGLLILGGLAFGYAQRKKKMRTQD